MRRPSVLVSIFWWKHNGGVGLILQAYWSFNRLVSWILRNNKTKYGRNEENSESEHFLTLSNICPTSNHVFTAKLYVDNWEHKKNAATQFENGERASHRNRDLQHWTRFFLSTSLGSQTKFAQWEDNFSAKICIIKICDLKLKLRNENILQFLFYHVFILMIFNFWRKEI